MNATFRTLTRFTGALLAACFIASTSFAANKTDWGQLKQHITTAAKRPTTNTTDASDALVDLSAQETRSTTVHVYPKGKSMLDLDDFNDGSTLHDNLKATLIIPSGAVSQEVDITMTLIGNKLSDLVVAFQPGGLVFNTAAQLRIQLGADLVDLDVSTLEVWHEYADGTVDKLILAASKSYKNGWTYLAVDIPGFSRYGLSGGW